MNNFFHSKYVYVSTKSSMNEYTYSLWSVHIVLITKLYIYFRKRSSLNWTFQDFKHIFKRDRNGIGIASVASLRYIKKVDDAGKTRVREKIVMKAKNKLVQSVYFIIQYSRIKRRCDGSQINGGKKIR